MYLRLNTRLDMRLRTYSRTRKIIFKPNHVKKVVEINNRSLDGICSIYTIGNQLT